MSLPRPELNAALATLQQHHDEWNVVLDFFRAERELCLGDLLNDASVSDVMKTAGRVISLDFILKELGG